MSRTPSLSATFVAFACAWCSLLAISLTTVVNAQTPTPGQLDPAATCPYEVADQIQQCRAQVYADEAALPGGPCHDGDWACICNVQQGLVACYYPCPGTTPQTDVDYNNANCNGQNGVNNAAATPGGAEYFGSPLTTTGGTATAEGTTTASTTGTSTTSTTAAPTSTFTPTSDPAGPASSTSSTVSSSSSSSSSGGNSSAPPPPAQNTSGGSVFDGSKPGAANRLVVLQGGVQAGFLLGFLLVSVVVGQI